MTLTHSSRLSASKPQRNNCAEREQNPHYCHYNGLKHLDADPGHTTIRNPQAARGTERQVEDAAANPWSAVGDHNYYRSVGRKISNANSRAERQAAVRCSWQIPIER